MALVVKIEHLLRIGLTNLMDEVLDFREEFHLLAGDGERDNELSVDLETKSLIEFYKSRN